MTDPTALVTRLREAAMTLHGTPAHERQRLHSPRLLEQAADVLVTLQQEQRKAYLAYSTLSWSERTVAEADERREAFEEGYNAGQTSGMSADKAYKRWRGEP